ncbi:hypothetical protein GLOIN_2v1483165 [Rhizophagus clarus]|uniref:Uncharacterized protein n=1 Tax=Rhizophagus clarus TaxID=94130 RepID=A0A8H3LG05_9GLOM|nr:hypothetical protein GLOIN_2v1483165 [Rhizophagus clarus]
MTLFKSKSKVKPSDTEINEKKDEKNYNSSIVPTDDDNCTITIIVPPTARPRIIPQEIQYSHYYFDFFEINDHYWRSIILYCKFSIKEMKFSRKKKKNSVDLGVKFIVV